MEAVWNFAGFDTGAKKPYYCRRGFGRRGSIFEGNGD
uniref:Uncharacterized protein n=1 Tax=viral metagenome TaxID=1070528 RepID=A0A6C0I6C5_9ZZZZ